MHQQSAVPRFCTYYFRINSHKLHVMASTSGRLIDDITGHKSTGVQECLKVKRCIKKKWILLFRWGKPEDILFVRRTVETVTSFRPISLKQTSLVVACLDCFRSRILLFLCFVLRVNLLSFLQPKRSLLGRCRIMTDWFYLIFCPRGWSRNKLNK